MKDKIIATNVNTIEHKMNKKKRAIENQKRDKHEFFCIAQGMKIKK
jgi:hypothetical protein